MHTMLSTNKVLHLLHRISAYSRQARIFVALVFICKLWNYFTLRPEKQFCGLQISFIRLYFLIIGFLIWLYYTMLVDLDCTFPEFTEIIPIILEYHLFEKHTLYVFDI